MNRTQDNEPSNPISRAFSRFFERGKVGRKDDAPTRTSTASTRAATPTATPAMRQATRVASPATPQRPATASGSPGFAGTTASPSAQRPATATPVAATPTATPTATLRTHTVRSGDTLSGIAQEVYGRADRWQLIFQANRDKIDDPDRIFPGQVLVIPDAPSVH